MAKTKIDKKTLGGWKEKAVRAQKRLQSATKRADVTIETIVHTAEVGSAAFVAGVVQGRTGGVEVLGVPIDLGAAAALHVLAFAGVGGKMSGHLHGFADGFLAAFLATTGRGVGQAWAAKEEATPAKATGELMGHHAAALPAGPGAMLTEEDRRMAAMAAAI